MKYLITIKCLENNNYYQCYNNKYKLNDKLIIDVDGLLLTGNIVNIKNEVTENININSIKIERKISTKDLSVINKNMLDASKALVYIKKIKDKYNDNMIFVNSYYTFDRKQLIFLFVSDSRVDFRDLAKKIAQKYKTRIELRQIGVRDKAKIIGGIGVCGLNLCCNNFLNGFNSVSINVVKNQMLTLNPSKINGLCGRLMCCLTYEAFDYDLKDNKINGGD